MWDIQRYSLEFLRGERRVLSLGEMAEYRRATAPKPSPAQPASQGFFHDPAQAARLIAARDAGEGEVFISPPMQPEIAAQPAEAEPKAQGSEPQANAGMERLRKLRFTEPVEEKVDFAAQLDAAVAEAEAKPKPEAVASVAMVKI
jgi:hypothetical protein